MFTITDLIDLQTLSESAELEFKLAQGKDGKGKLPDDFWPTYSAMANSRGGYVVLGIREKKGKFSIAGLEDIETIKKQLFNIANNKQMVNVNILSDQSIKIVTLESRQILVIKIPAASREQKPVYLKNQPMKCSYFRLHEGDRVCSDEQVKRMMAEQVEDSRDNKVLQNYDMEDIEVGSLQAYRQLLSARSPQHPFLELDNFNFLRNLGGWRKDRETGVEGMTIAGILMFGTWQAIRDTAPNYFVDYQERPEAKTERRWIDRICPDGTWSGNIFDFYRRTYRKLTVDLKVPFELKDGIRQDETQVHVALREALVNTLVHADYTGRLSIMVVKRPDMFGFRNPGLMRISLEQARVGGDSDCRNKTIQQMFLMIGAGERSGSGIPKIYSGWKWANWRVPKLHEKIESEQTLLELSIGSLISEEIAELLHKKFGDSFNHLNELERIIVITAAAEGWVNHERACQLTTQHSREVTLALPKLVDRAFLVAYGEKRDKSYSLPGMQLPSPEEVFASNPLSEKLVITDSEDNITDSEDNITDIEIKRDDLGRFISDKLSYPYIDDFEMLDIELQSKLKVISKPAKDKKRLNNDVMDKIVLQLCEGHFIPLSVISILVDRTSQNIREKQLAPLVEKGAMVMAFPHAKRHKQQGYMTKNN